jgi:hypothetical protein
MRVATEVIVMAKLDHDPGSRSRTMSVVYPRDFPLDTEGSQQAGPKPRKGGHLYFASG